MQQHIAAVITDAKRSITWVNQDFTQITGYTLDEVIGKKPSILQGAGTSQSDVNRIRQHFTTNQPFKDSIINYTKDGREYKCTFVIHPLFDKAGSISKYLAFEVDESLNNESLLPTLKIKEKYASSSLKISDQAALYARFHAMVIQEKLYLDPDISLKDLANRLHTNTRYLSQVVNTLTSHNLQHFINIHRIDEVKKGIMSDDFHDHTLYGIAQRCGYKNKSTFFKVFKEITGQTPKEYVKEQYNKLN